MKMMGIVLVAAFAIDATTKPPVAAITATRRRTKSAANSGSLSGLFSAHRYSIATFSPSTYPTSFRPWRNPRRRSANPSGDLGSSNPITGIVGCCAFEASGHAAAAPPRSVIKWRRCIAFPRLTTTSFCLGHQSRKRRSTKRVAAVNVHCKNSDRQCLRWVKSFGSTRPTISRHVRCASDSDRIGARGSPPLCANSRPEYSIATLRPSTQPSSRSRCTKALTHALQSEGVDPPKNPIVGSFAACCARAASGQAAAPPSILINPRRLN
jgi:hypothetical protein